MFLYELRILLVRGRVKRSIFEFHFCATPSIGHVGEQVNHVLASETYTRVASSRGSEIAEASERGVKNRKIIERVSIPLPKMLIKEL